MSGLPTRGAHWGGRSQTHWRSPGGGEPAGRWQAGGWVRDVNAPVRHGEWLAERIAGARLVVDSRSAHLATLVHNWDAILSELSRVTREVLGLSR